MALTLHHMSHYVKDVDASAAFYMSVLGLTEIPNRIGNPKIRWFDLDGIRSIHLIPGDTVPDRPRPFSTHVALATTEFDALVERLKSLGVEYVDITRAEGRFRQRADGIRQVYFQDPDGHWIEINDATEGP